MKKYLILLLVIAFATSMLFIGISCKEEVPLAEEVVEEEVEEGVPPPEKVVEEEEEVSPVEEEKPYKGQTRLTNNQADDYEPSWSPDGKMIAFESDRDGNWEIYVINTDGQDKRLIKILF